MIRIIVISYLENDTMSDSIISLWFPYHIDKKGIKNNISTEIDCIFAEQVNESIVIQQKTPCVSVILSSVDENRQQNDTHLEKPK